MIAGRITPYYPSSWKFCHFCHFCHIPLYWRRVQYQTIFPSSLVDYAYAQKTCALESRIARSVTMERRSFARTLLWRNNHTYPWHTACNVSKILSNQHWMHLHFRCIQYQLTTDGTTAMVSQLNLWCLHKMPDINNNNYIAWPYIRGIPADLRGGGGGGGGLGGLNPPPLGLPSKN